MTVFAAPLLTSANPGTSGGGMRIDGIGRACRWRQELTHGACRLFGKCGNRQSIRLTCIRAEDSGCPRVSDDSDAPGWREWLIFQSGCEIEHFIERFGPGDT